MLHFTERVAVDLEGVAVHALVALPRAPLVIGRSRLQRFRKRVEINPLDRNIIAAIRDRPGVSAFVFCGRSDDGRGFWQFSEDLSMSEALELGELFHYSHMPTYRQMAAVGVLANIHIRLGEREKESLELGRAMALTRLQAQLGHPGRNAVLDRLDVWLLDHFNSFHREEDLGDVLPSLSVARRRVTLLPLVQALSAEGLSAPPPSPSQEDPK